MKKAILILALLILLAGASLLLIMPEGEGGNHSPTALDRISERLDQLVNGSILPTGIAAGIGRQLDRLAGQCRFVPLADPSRQILINEPINTDAFPHSAFVRLNNFGMLCNGGQAEYPFLAQPNAPGAILMVRRRIGRNFRLSLADGSAQFKSEKFHLEIEVPGAFFLLKSEGPASFALSKESNGVNLFLTSGKFVIGAPELKESGARFTPLPIFTFDQSEAYSNGKLVASKEDAAVLLPSGLTKQ